MFKKLVKIPLYFLWLITVMTVIIPIAYWVITGNDYSDLFDYIDDM